MGLHEDLVEQRGQLDAKRAELAAIFKEAGETLDMSKVKAVTGTNVEKAAKMAKLHGEINTRSVEVDTIASAVEAAKAAKLFEKQGKVEDDDDTDDKPSGTKGKFRFPTDGWDDDAAQEAATKSFGQLFTESAAYKNRAQYHAADIDVPHMKTLMTTSAGFAPESTRSGLVVPLATRPIQVIDLIPSGRTSQAAIVYMEETTFTNNAAETAEGGTYPESALALTQRTNTVSKVATWIPVTDEQLEDVPQIQSYIDGRLMFMVRQRLDSQLLVGNGTPPNLRGILNVVGIQTQARGADPGPDAVYKAMVNVMVTGRAFPNGLIMHPTNWMGIKLLKTADGIYLWGSPADNNPDRLWGMPVALSDAITLNTAVVGDFATHSQLVIRRDVEVQVTNAHSTFFIEGKQAIRADMRCAFVVYRPAAFSTITGLL